MRIHWTPSLVKSATKILSRTSIDRIDAALEEISEIADAEVSIHALIAAFRRNGLDNPHSYCKLKTVKTRIARVSDEKEADEEKAGDLENVHMQRLFKFTKKDVLNFSDLCDKMDMSPTKLKTLIAQAKEQGMRLNVENNHVGIQHPKEDERVKNVGVAPVVGERQKVAVISDTHLGSKYCLREQLREFIHYAYSQGVREILHPGDWVDGDYRHGKFEMSHMGLDDQAQDLFEVLPQLPGLTYHGITGNHDYTFTEQSGISVGQFLSNYFRERGRNDIHFYGDRSAFLKIRGIVVHLWHPRSGVSYARSYALQKQIEKYPVGAKSHVLIAGHWHVFCYVEERGVHAIACPTFQGGGSAFGKSLGGAPAIGGLLLSWDITGNGTMRSFVLEKRTYFEVEEPTRVRTEPNGIPVFKTK